MTDTGEPIKLENTQTRTVLVVDDDKISRKVLTEMLGKLGFQVSSAEGGAKALEILKNTTSPFDIVLVDVMMPEMDGFELLRIFRKAYSHDTPIIMISSSEDPDTISKSFKHGAQDFLQKPIQPEMLERRVKVSLEERARRRKEIEYNKILAQEREKQSLLSKQLQEQEKELQQIKDTIETPMSAVMKTVGELMYGEYSKEQYQAALIAILKSLGSHDLYKPAFNMLLEDSKLDSVTKDWLLSEFISNDDSKQIKKKGMHSPRRSSKEAFEHTLQTISAKHILPEVGSFSFDVYAHKPEELIHGVLFMLEDLGLIEQYGFDKTKLTAFLVKIKSLYKDNPYHTFTHAVDVTQFVYATLKIDKVATFLSNHDCLCLMLAALVHDLEHPGLNNNYQVNARTQLAMTYNDISVLENHHSASAFKVIGEKNYNFLEKLSPEEFKELRKSVISLILATDMAHHFELFTKFQTRLQTGQLSKDNKEDKQQLMNMILKAADISNVVRPFKVAKVWANALIQEFCAQGDIEKEQGMPISPLMDRKSLDKTKMQVNFMDFIAGPLFKTLAECIPDLKPLVDVMNANRASWLAGLGNDEPTSSDTKATVYGSVPENSSKVRGFSVLIIDANQQVRDTLDSMLSVVGYTTKSVASVNDAVSELEKGNFDLVLVACQPDKIDDVNQFAQRVRGGSGHIKNIAIVALAHENQKEQLSKSALDQVLTVPIHILTLLKHIEQILEKVLQHCPPVNLTLARELCVNDDAFVFELLNDLLTMSVMEVQLIEQGIAKSDYKAIQDASHKIKGGAAQIATKPTSIAAFVLEKAAKEKKPMEEMQENVKVLKQRLKEVEAFVAQQNK